jgi:hypothetical protein
VRYVTGETTMKEGTDFGVPPEKALVEQEKELLDKYKVVLCCYKPIVSPVNVLMKCFRHKLHKAWLYYFLNYSFICYILCNMMKTKHYKQMFVFVLFIKGSTAKIPFGPNSITCDCHICTADVFIQQ